MSLSYLEAPSVKPRFFLRVTKIEKGPRFSGNVRLFRILFPSLAKIKSLRGMWGVYALWMFRVACHGLTWKQFVLIKNNNGLTLVLTPIAVEC